MTERNKSRRPDPGKYCPCIVFEENPRGRYMDEYIKNKGGRKKSGSREKTRKSK